MAKCSSCGDIAACEKKWNGLVKCEECYEELANGRIINIGRANLPDIYGGKNGRAEDTSPFEQNAIRALEDNR